MGNPITDLAHWAEATWDRVSQEIVAPWHQVYDLFEFPPWRDAVNQMLTGLAAAVERVAVLAGTSDLDTIEIVRDGLDGTYRNLAHLRDRVLPAYEFLARRYAYEQAIPRARQAEQWAWQRITAEARARARGDHDVMAWVNDQAAGKGYDTARREAARGLAATLARILGNDHVDKLIVDTAIRLLTILATADLPELRPEIERLVSLILRFTGLDKDLAAVISGQLGALTGAGVPKTLAAAEHDTAVRLARLEEAAGAAADVLAPLKSESGVLREMGTIAFDASLLGWLAAGIAAPRAWADDTSRVISAVAGPVLDPVLDLLRAPAPGRAAAGPAETAPQAAGPAATPPGGPVTWQVTAVTQIPPPGHGHPPVPGSDLTVATSNGWTLHVFVTTAQLSSPGAVTAAVTAAVRGALAAAAAAAPGPPPAAG